MFSGLHQRAPSGLLLVAALGVALLWAPAVSLWVLLVTIATIALLEFYHLLDLAGIPSFRVVGVVCGVGLITLTWLACVRHWAHDPEPLWLAACVLLVLLRFLPHKNNGQPLATMACTLMGILYVPLLFNYFTKLGFAWNPPELLGRVDVTGGALVCYLVAVVKTTDIGAYFVGSLCGRHKLIPRISPGKTWEGFFGGLAAGLAMSLLLRALFHGHCGLLPLRLADAMVLGLLLPLAGTAGDLTESMLKRAAGAKDSSVVIPGMGGVLDVLDSLLFAAPVLYAYARYVMA